MSYDKHGSLVSLVLCFKIHESVRMQDLLIEASMANCPQLLED
jgi:hypothetical protein